MPDINQTEQNDPMSNNAPDSSAEGTKKDAAGGEIPLQNRLAELTRKFTRYQENMDEKFGQLVQILSQQKAGSKAQEDDDSSSDLDPKAYADFRFKQVKEELKNESMVEKHKTSFHQALKVFPELNQESETYDKSFFQAANKYYEALKGTDADAPMKAARLAAIDFNKYEQIERERVLTDEAKRSRMLGDGISSPRGHQKQEVGITDNLKSLAQLLGKDQKKLGEFYEKNKARYQRSA